MTSENIKPETNANTDTSNTVPISAPNKTIGTSDRASDPIDGACALPGGDPVLRTISCLPSGVTEYVYCDTAVVRMRSVTCFRCGEFGHRRNECRLFRVNLCPHIEVCDDPLCTFAHDDVELRKPWLPRCVRVIKTDYGIEILGCGQIGHTYHQCSSIVSPGFGAIVQHPKRERTSSANHYSPSLSQHEYRIDVLAQLCDDE